MTQWHNWAGLETRNPARTVTPTSAEQIAHHISDAAESGTTVKMVGTGHSFTGIAAPEHTMLRPDRMSGIVSVDADRNQVTALAGTRLEDFNSSLAELGLSLHNMGDIAEQTLAGAISTGTHGTGGRASGLAAQVVGLQLVDGTGQILDLDADREPELFDFARLGLGALGVLTTITFAVEPLFLLEATEEPMGWDEAWGRFDELTADQAHLDMYWFPHTDRMLTKRNRRLSDPIENARPVPTWRRILDDELLSNTLFGAETAALNHAPRLIPRANRVNARLLGARTYSDIAHRVFTSSRHVVFKEMEYAVPREVGPTALAEIRRAIDASDLAISFPVEVRATPADDIPLSTASGRESVYLAFHTHRRADHVAYFNLVEPILRAHDGRPHWGKLHTLRAHDFAALYPRFEEFCTVRDRLDPHRVFRNEYLDRVLR